MALLEGDPIEKVMKVFNILVVLFIIFIIYRMYKLYDGVPPHDSKTKCGLNPLCILYNWKYILGMKDIKEVNWRPIHL